LYESSHRIRNCLDDIATIYPASRKIVVARELTKCHESICDVKIADIATLFEQNPYAEKGEFVVVIQGDGVQSKQQQVDLKTQQTLKILLSECSLKTAVDLATQITGMRKKLLYQAALELQDQL
jgi:16S rRNA (cytidine1402-2'-O)-methyltransferase